MRTRQVSRRGGWSTSRTASRATVRTAGGTLAGAPLPGPNLTDSAWIHGGAPLQIHTTITNGVVEKGMLAWGPILGPTKVQQVAAYVLSIRDTNVDGGKEPQGAVPAGGGGGGD